MDQKTINELKATACKVRMGVIEGTHGAKAGHPGGSLSAADMFTYLYFKELNVDPKDPKNDNRDRFVLSKHNSVSARQPFPILRQPVLPGSESYGCAVLHHCPQSGWDC